MNRIGALRQSSCRKILPSGCENCSEKELSLFDNADTLSQKNRPKLWNILSNSKFCTLLSDNALGYTYAMDSRENQLTPQF